MGRKPPTDRLARKVHAIELALFGLFVRVLRPLTTYPASQLCGIAMATAFAIGLVAVAAALRRAVFGASGARDRGLVGATYVLAALMLPALVFAMRATLGRFPLVVPFSLMSVIYWGYLVSVPVLGLVVGLWQGLRDRSAGRPFAVRFRRLGVFTLAWLAAGAGAFYYSYVWEPNRIEVTRHEIDVPAGVPPIRVVHITDIQTDRLGERERAIPEIVRKLDPDLIVMTGDYINSTWRNNPRGFRAARWVVERLHAPLGVYAIQGDTDTPEGHKALFEGTDVVLLNNSGRRIAARGGSFYVVGLNQQYMRIDLAFDSVPEGAPVMLLAHSPDVVYALAERTDRKPFLTLVGHTHGGQVCLPGGRAVVSFTRLPAKYASGLFDNLMGYRVYISRGLGFEGNLAPRIRTFCRPEIAVLDLRSRPRAKR